MKVRILGTILRTCLAIWTTTGIGLAQSGPAWTEPVSLAGQWRFALDPNQEGVEKQFFNHELPERISLPGSTDEAKMGTPNPNKPTLDGLYRLYLYEGPAWFQRDVEIPETWKGRQVSLFLERTHWDTAVWVDDKSLGTQDSLIAPHVYDLGSDLAPGRHRLTICVGNARKIDLGRFVSINYSGTQTNWNGLIGKLELRAKDPVCVADVQVYPDVERKLAKVRMVITNITGKAASGKVILGATGTAGAGKVPPLSVKFMATQPRTVISAELPMGENPRLWDEFSPALYALTVSMTAKSTNQTFADRQTITFGMRKFATRGTQFTINNRPVFLRGTLECAIFPLTGYPPTDVPSWQRIYRIIKSYGLNFIRFHSWCPPEAAFTAADLEGVMIQAEGPQANVPAGEDQQRDAFVEQELLRMIRTYGNHPSFCLMTLGNEFGGSDAVLSHWVDMLIKEDPRRLYSSASSAQITANRQFTERGRPRGVQGPGTDIDFREDIAKEDRPLIGHEIGQWTFYPNFNESKKYTGVLAAKNFDLVRDDLAAKHLLDLAPRFVQATGRHAVLLYKEEIEILMRTPGHAGFSLLDLHDYPGQGTALIGALDPFWDSKGFVTPEAHRRYCGATVPLLRMKKRTFTRDETFAAEAEIAHFGPRDLTKAQPVWTLRDESGREVASGSWAARSVPTGKLTSLGGINASLAKAPAPAKLTVTVSLQGTAIANQWDIWVYPAHAEASAPADVVIARNWDDATRAALASGKKVILFPQVVNSSQSLPGRFLPVFWSPVWFPTQQPNTMGILCDPKHPALAQFPTEFYSNWQWYELLQNSRSVNLNDTPATFRPIVEIIDNFARNNKLGNLFEARVGGGSLLVCTMDLLRLADNQPAAKQLLRSLYAYAGSVSFNPSEELQTALLDKLFSPSGP
ncbi:MAG: sugar-binding domain-containing protein [Terriglobia bacterium]